jgi:nitrite reductase/ring-hydroxylating ferredoxin subunit
MTDKSDENKPDERPMVFSTGYGTENPIDFAFKVIEEARPPKARSGKRLTVCAASEIPEGGRRIVTDGALSIGVFNVAGKLYALRNVCPHYGAPLCQGTIHATHRPSDVHEFDPALHGRVLRCPWHGWEFDIITGKGLFDESTKVATYPVEIDEKGDVVVIL